MRGHGDSPGADELPIVLSVAAAPATAAWLERQVSGSAEIRAVGGLDAALACLRECRVDLVVVQADHPSLSDTAAGTLDAIAPGVLRIAAMAADPGPRASLWSDYDLAVTVTDSVAPQAPVVRLLRRAVAARELQLERQGLGSALHAADAWGRDVRRWLGDLIHELRTPVAIVHGHGANLRDGVYGPLGEALSLPIGRIVEAADLLGDLLARAVAGMPALPDAGRVRHEPRAVRQRADLGALLERAVGLFAAQAAARGIGIELTRGQETFAWCHPTSVLQVLVNILGNAVRHTPDGGTIRGVAGPADGEPGLTAVGAVALSLANTGPAIPAADRVRIFERGVTTGGPEHAGIGLAICAEIVGAHGGTIAADSEDGWTRFRIVLPGDPRARRASEWPDAPPLSPPRSATRRASRPATAAVSPRRGDGPDSGR